MRIGRYDFGLWNTKETWFEMPWFEYLKGNCGCKFYTIKKFVLTYYGTECYKELKENKKDGI